MPAAEIGIYIHFPFCLSRCPYCDFATTAGERIPHEEYARAVMEELAFRRASWRLDEREVVSIYLGGGTPSLWDPRCVGRVIDCIHEVAAVRRGAEITMEVNPGPIRSPAAGHLRPPSGRAPPGCSKGRAGPQGARDSWSQPDASHRLATTSSEWSLLCELKEVGITRLSFGTQSFERENLELLGRRHGEKDSRLSVERARRAGFENVSLDLIYSLPGQSAAAAALDAGQAALARPDHVSAYCLTLHEGVPMAREVAAGRLSLPDEDESVEIEEAVFETLESEGYERYEISSFARQGKKAVHNTSYWTVRECLALGAAAHGVRLFNGCASSGGARYRNVTSPDRYIELASMGSDTTEQEESLGPIDLLRERLFLGMRLTDGVDLGELEAWSGIDPVATHGDELRRLEREGLIELRGRRARPTWRGLRFNDVLAARLG